MRKSFAAAAAAMVLFVCASASAGIETPRTDSAYGPLSATEQSLVGTDIDKNGVRDDVDAWIAGRFPEPTRQLATQHAQWLTLAMLRGWRGSSTSKAELEVYAVVSGCTLKSDAKGRPTAAVGPEDWERAVFDTKERFAGYLKWVDDTNDTRVPATSVPCTSGIGVPKA